MNVVPNLWDHMESGLVDPRVLEYGSQLPLRYGNLPILYQVFNDTISNN